VAIVHTLPPDLFATDLKVTVSELKCRKFIEKIDWRKDNVRNKAEVI